ncbi:alpha/beta hydrolase [Nocardia sp. CNY236]|uniref:alpha/beta hydrolase n=1 Tax=Nocardia sp. CNY236 TaxID=1169152 RepID=UPI00040CE866|nr:alpha/beta hydrolase [Nocardia sp. CNY236]
MTPVVLVHGFWHASWCWSLVTEQLAASGIPSVAVDLDGHGLRSRSPESRWRRPFDPAVYAVEPSRTSAVTASSAAQTLVEQIRAIGGGERVVVVAHSMGGAVATAAAELEPSLFSHLVYVSAFAPVDGAVAQYSASPENEGEMTSTLLVADPMVVGAARLDIGDPSRHSAAREVFYGDVDRATADAAIGLLQPDGPIGIPAEDFTVTADRFGTVPHSYVVCTKDNAIPVALQRRFVREIDAVSATPTTVTELDSSHSPFLSQPAALAAIIAGIC